MQRQDGSIRLKTDRHLISRGRDMKRHQREHKYPPIHSNWCVFLYLSVPIQQDESDSSSRLEQIKASKHPSSREKQKQSRLMFWVPPRFSHMYKHCISLSNRSRREEQRPALQHHRFIFMRGLLFDGCKNRTQVEGAGPHLMWELRHTHTPTGMSRHTDSRWRCEIPHADVQVRISQPIRADLCLHGPNGWRW